MTEPKSDLSSSEIQTRRERSRLATAKWRAAHPEKARDSGRKSMAKRRATKPEEHREYQITWQEANAERMKIYQKRKIARVKANREANRNTPEGIERAARAKEYRRAYYLANRERELEKARLYREEKKEDKRKYHKEYYIANKERYKKQQRAWVAANLDKHNARSHRRRALLAKVKSTFTAADWQALVARSKHCHWCKTPFTTHRRPTHDHVIPISKGGPNTLENSVCACLSCNVGKQAQLVNPVTRQGILL